jgi:hypothetical protein
MTTVPKDDTRCNKRWQSKYITKNTSTIQSEILLTREKKPHRTAVQNDDTRWQSKYQYQQFVMTTVFYSNN